MKYGYQNTIILWFLIFKDPLRNMLMGFFSTYQSVCHNGLKKQKKKERKKIEGLIFF